MIWLSRELGMTPRRLLSEMTSLDLAEQMAYDQLMGQERAATADADHSPQTLPSQDELRAKIERIFGPKV